MEGNCVRLPGSCIFTGRRVDLGMSAYLKDHNLFSHAKSGEKLHGTSKINIAVG